MDEGLKLINSNKLLTTQVHSGKTIVLFIATSLDGYIASPDGAVDWLFDDADYGYTEFMASMDAVVMGRKTWEQARTFEDVPFAGKQVVVFSRSSSHN